jgi:hypothetical protein
MDNVQKHNTCINVTSSQTFRSYLSNIVFQRHILRELFIAGFVNTIPVKIE